MTDHLIRTLLAEKRLRAVAAVTTDLSRHAATIHGLTGPAAEALSRLLTASGLLATLTKDRELVSVQIQGDGPVALLAADADAQGNIRGYARFRRDFQEASTEGGAPTPAPGDRDGREDREPGEHEGASGSKEGVAWAVRVEDLVGRQGTVVVIRDLGLKELYQGMAELTDGSVDRDVETYLNQSEQLPSFLRCRAVLDGNGQISAAGGILVQSMPGGRDDLDRVVGSLPEDFLEALLADVAAGHGELSAEAIVARLGQPDVEVGEWRDLRFHCRCSKESAERALRSLGPAEVRDILEKDGKAEVTCHYCTKTWVFDARELTLLLEDMERA